MDSKLKLYGANWCGDCRGDSGVEKYPAIRWP